MLLLVTSNDGRELIRVSVSGAVSLDLVGRFSGWIVGRSPELSRGRRSAGVSERVTVSGAGRGSCCGSCSAGREVVTVSGRLTCFFVKNASIKRLRGVWGSVYIPGGAPAIQLLRS